MTTTTSNDTTAAIAANPTKAWQVWTGRVFTALPAMMLTFSAALKLSQAPGFVAMWTGKLGYPESTLSGVGALELLCVAVYLVPRTAVLGALLLTAYLGGAVTSHLRVGDPFAIPIVLGVLVWGGLYLGDDRVRSLIPLRGPARRNAP